MGYVRGDVDSWTKLGFYQEGRKKEMDVLKADNSIHYTSFSNKPVVWGGTIQVGTVSA